MSITSLELARICGTSRGTVDRALKGRPGVNPETRQRILAAAKEHGYRPNLIGQTLASGKSNTLGVVFFDFSHDFFAELYSAFEQVADQSGFVTFPVLSYHDPKREIMCINRLLDRLVDGIILLPVNHGEEFEEFLSSLPVPVVTVGNRLSPRFSFCAPNDRQAAYDAASALFAAGNSRIHYFSPILASQTPSNRYAQEERYAGWKMARDEHAFTGMECHNTTALLEVLVPGDAVLFSSDFYALEFQSELREEHPELFASVTLMGFDGLDILRLFARPIPSVYFSRKIWAETAFRQLQELLDGKEPSHMVIPHEIINLNGGCNA